MKLSTHEGAYTLADIGRSLSLLYHGDVRNKHDGELYILHLNRVAVRARNAARLHGLNEDIMEAIAWLHDFVEDLFTDDHQAGYDCIESEFERFNTPKEIIDIILAGVNGMTKRKGESNEVYYLRCRENEYSRVCKRDADMVDNFSRNHLIEDPAVQVRMATKYSLGMSIL